MLNKTIFPVPDKEICGLAEYSGRQDAAPTAQIAHVKPFAKPRRQFCRDRYRNSPLPL
jgi:hypothetical protein